MTRASILPSESALFRRLHQAAVASRCVFFAGLPGVGKSLLLQQLALIAGQRGRSVHLLQWDVARGPFETPELLARYPETDGVTHPAIRKAVGLWARGAVDRWDRRAADPRHLLVGEVPLIGNRLIELVQPRSDDVEALLAGAGTVFFIPVPSREVRRAIEAARAREMTSPSHERERANAIPSLVQALWEEVAAVARELALAPTHQEPGGTADQAVGEERGAEAGGAEAGRLVAGREAGGNAGVGREADAEAQAGREADGEAGPGRGFDPEIYALVYQRLLRHRRAERLPVTSALPVEGSVYDLADTASELVPTVDEVERIMAEVGARPAAELEREVAGWFGLA
jgi:hypothetical protein